HPSIRRRLGANDVLKRAKRKGKGLIIEYLNDVERGRVAAHPIPKRAKVLFLHGKAQINRGPFHLPQARLHLDCRNTCLYIFPAPLVIPVEQIWRPRICAAGTLQEGPGNQEKVRTFPTLPSGPRLQERFIDCISTESLQVGKWLAPGCAVGDSPRPRTAVK